MDGEAHGTFNKGVFQNYLNSLSGWDKPEPKIAETTSPKCTHCSAYAVMKVSGVSYCAHCKSVPGDTTNTQDPSVEVIPPNKLYVIQWGKKGGEYYEYYSHTFKKEYKYIANGYNPEPHKVLNQEPRLFGKCVVCAGTYCEKCDGCAANCECPFVCQGCNEQKSKRVRAKNSNSYCNSCLCKFCQRPMAEHAKLNLLCPVCTTKQCIHGCPHNDQRVVASEVWRMSDINVSEMAAKFYFEMYRSLKTPDKYLRGYEDHKHTLAPILASYLDMVVGGELRHAGSQLPGVAVNDFTLARRFIKKSGGIGRNGGWAHWYKYRKKYGLQILEEAAALMHSYEWRGSYGGESWGSCADTLLRFYRGEISSELFIDLAFALEHNNGCIFDKFFGGTRKIRRVLDANLASDYQKLAGYLPMNERENGYQYLLELNGIDAEEANRIAKNQANEYKYDYEDDEENYCTCSECNRRED